MLAAEQFPPDWPGHVTTVAGLAAALRKLLEDAPKIATFYQNLVPLPPRPKMSRELAAYVKGKPSVLIPGVRKGPPTPREIALQLADAAWSIPGLLRACDLIIAADNPLLAAVGNVQIPVGRLETLPDYADLIYALNVALVDARALVGTGNRPSRTAARVKVADLNSKIAAAQAEADQLAADWAELTYTLRQVLVALAILEGIEMPPAIGTTTVIIDLAQRIHQQISEGHGGRLVVDESEKALSWTSGLPLTLLSYLAPGVAKSRHIETLMAKDSGTPTTPVAVGGTKPNAVTYTPGELDLAKFAGITSMPTENAMFVTNIETAVSAVMVTRLIRGIEQDAVTVMQAAAGVVVTAATDLTQGLLQGIAGIASNGGQANVIGLSAADWLTLFSAQGAAGGYVNISSPEGGPGLFMGCYPTIVPGLAAGDAIVADGRAVQVLELEGSPLCLVNPYSSLQTNGVEIAIETWAATSVTSPGSVASVAVGAGARKAK